MTGTLRHGDVMELFGELAYPPTPVDCWVEVGGVRANDGSDPAVAGPVVLSGLSLTWGRSTTVDQPDTATVKAELLDTSGGSTFTELATVGASVRVWASGTAWDPENTVQTFTDPGWEATTLPSSRISTTQATAALVPVDGRGQVLQLTPPASRTASCEIRVAPADVTGALDAWDHIPRTEVGQVWVQRIGWGWASPGATVRVGVIRYTAPGQLERIDWDPKVTRWDPAGGPFQRSYAVTAAGRWLGTAVQIVTPGYTWATAPWGTWADVPPTLTWADLAARLQLDDMTMDAPAGGLSRAALVFDGRITDAVAEWDLGLGGAVVSFTAADVSAELANRDVGAEPWPAETIATRAARIVAASGLPLALRVDPQLADLVVGRVDVDRQQVWPMLADLATSADGVCWSAAHATEVPYVWLAALAARPSVLVLAEDPDTGLVGVHPAANSPGSTISACDVDLEPVRWVRSNSDVATRVVVTWADQSTTPDPTERTVQVSDPAMESDTARYGVRRVSVQSQLTTEADALAVAEAVLYRLSRTTSWRIGGVEFQVRPDTPGAAVPMVLDLLDGTTRIGRAVLLTDLPTWAPAASAALPGYLEGGTYEYAEGAWRLSMILSNAEQAVGASVTWAELDPTWTWADMDPALTWADLQGVGGPVPAGHRYFTENTGS